MTNMYARLMSSVGGFLRYPRKILLIESVLIMVITLHLAATSPLSRLPEVLATHRIMGCLCIINACILFSNPVLDVALKGKRLWSLFDTSCLALQVCALVGIQIGIVSTFQMFPGYRAVCFLLLWTTLGRSVGIICRFVARVLNPWLVYLISIVSLMVIGGNTLFL
jgi:hypothetical protein